MHVCMFVYANLITLASYTNIYMHYIPSLSMIITSIVLSFPMASPQAETDAICAVKDSSPSTMSSSNIIL